MIKAAVDLSKALDPAKDQADASGQLLKSASLVPRIGSCAVLYSNAPGALYSGEYSMVYKSFAGDAATSWYSANDWKALADRRDRLVGEMGNEAVVNETLLAEARQSPNSNEVLCVLRSSSLLGLYYTSEPGGAAKTALLQLRKRHAPDTKGPLPIYKFKPSSSQLKLVDDGVDAWAPHRAANPPIKD